MKTCLLPSFRSSLGLALLAAALAQLAGAAEAPAALLPSVPAGLKVELFAQEPLIRNPCAMVFDARGRLFVGQGPQYRNPRPDTPPDSVLILIDRNGDGVADTTKTFATGFNNIEGLAWHGRDLWVANAPDMTIVRDLDGDDEADEYIKVYTDLGNIEHGVHGLNWGPDGKFYFTKGNSKGLTQPGRVAPKPIRELWDVKAPPGTPDLPPPQTFRKGEYKLTYQDPRDDWGREGGVLRSDDLGRNLEIVARGTRNVFDIEFDHGFDWLGTDNDQSDGDRVIMPFQDAHFGWAHVWSAHWTGYRHVATAPISGPVFHGSGTGVTYYDYPQLPPEFRGVWFISDFLRKTTFAYRPQWDGALMLPQGGTWQEFARGGDALFKPVDIAIGPDGALYLTGWGTELGVVWKDGQQANEGRIFRISWPQAPRPAWNSARREKPLADWTVADLVADFDAPLPVWHTNAQDELVRRGAAVKSELMAMLGRPGLSTAAETWALWTVGRIAPQDTTIDAWLATAARASVNARIQAIRIAAHRIREFRPADRLPGFVTAALQEAEPRVRFAAVQAIGQARQKHLLEPLLTHLAGETERLTFYAGWQGLRDLAGNDDLKKHLRDSRGGVRRAALLALLENAALDREAVAPLVQDADPQAAEVAAVWIAKQNGNPLIVMNPWPGDFTDQVTVKFTPGVKPGGVVFTTDGSEPTAAKRSGNTIQLKETTTLKIGLFVEGKQVGRTVEATWRKRAPRAAPPPIALSPRNEATTLAQVTPLLRTANATNGRAVAHAAACFTCHRIGDEGRAIGPDLSAIGDRGDAAHIIRSLLEPNAAITEGYALVSVSARDGKSFAGIFQEETDSVLTLMQLDGEPVTVEKPSITKRESAHVSVMPAFGNLLAPAQMADLVAWLMSQRTLAAVSPSQTPVTTPNTRAVAATARTALSFELKTDRLAIIGADGPVADYVFADAETWRPHFQNVRAPGGVQVTRRHPPVAPEALDHGPLHPGIWMAFGDVNGADFWRNKAKLEHVRFTEPPAVKDGRLQFATENRFVDPAGASIGTQVLRFTLWREGDAHWLLWDTTLKPVSGRELVFGDQEEMGLGVRLTAPLIEKNGGTIVNSNGERGARASWGKVADWCEYAGTIEGRRVGAAIFTHPENSQRTWWHNRDYGLMVANSFGKRVLPESNAGKVVVNAGSELRLRYGIRLFNAPASGPADTKADAARYLEAARAAR